VKNGEETWGKRFECSAEGCTNQSRIQGVSWRHGVRDFTSHKREGGVLLETRDNKLKVVGGVVY